MRNEGGGGGERKIAPLFNSESRGTQYSDPNLPKVLNYEHLILILASRLQWALNCLATETSDTNTNDVGITSIRRSLIGRFPVKNFRARATINQISIVLRHQCVLQRMKLSMRKTKDDLILN